MVGIHTPRSFLQRSCAAAILVWMFAALPGAAQKALDLDLPKPAEGNIDGFQAVNIVPEGLVNGLPHIVDPAGCNVYLVPTNVNERLTYPCTTWFAPPPDRYTIWIEKGNRLSEQTVLKYPGSKFANNGLVSVMSLKSAGFAQLSADANVGNQETVRFLSLQPSFAGFERRLQPGEAKAATRLPAGQALAGIFDARGNAVALSRPFTMQEGQTVVVTPKPPLKADLMIVLGKHEATALQREKETTVSLRAGGATRRPDVIYETDGRIIAVWYGLAENSAMLTVTSAVFRSPEYTISLPAGRVTTYREELTLK